jgi:hypothetical protein
VVYQGPGSIKADQLTFTRLDARPPGDGRQSVGTRRREGNLWKPLLSMISIDLLDRVAHLH